MNMQRVFDMRPSTASPRQSEGDFIRLADGAILFAYSRFERDMSDDSPSHIVAVRSTDEGKTWSTPEVIIQPEPLGGTNAMSVSFMPMQNGDIGLFFGLKGPWWYKYIMFARSTDGGHTFGGFARCSLPDRKGRYILNNSRVERLRSGRLVIPLAYHRTGKDEETGKSFYDFCSCICMLYSDDDGATWQEAPYVVHPPFTNSSAGLQEPGVVELANGVLWAYYRTDKMYQYESFSMDSGLHWTVPQPSRFTSPLSPMKIARRPQTGALYAFWNPIPNYNGRSQTEGGVWHGGRTPIVYATSQDEGSTWSDMRVIEDDPTHGYCYPAAFFTDDDAMLVAYCAGGVEDGSCLARVTMMRIPLAGEA